MIHVDVSSTGTGSHPKGEGYGKFKVSAIQSYLQAFPRLKCQSRVNVHTCLLQKL